MPQYTQVIDIWEVVTDDLSDMTTHQPLEQVRTHKEYRKLSIESESTYTTASSMPVLFLNRIASFVLFLCLRNPIDVISVFDCM